MAWADSPAHPNSREAFRADRRRAGDDHRRRAGGREAGASQGGPSPCRRGGSDRARRCSAADPLVNALDASSADAASIDLVPVGAQVARHDLAQALVVLDDQDSATAVTHRRSARPRCRRPRRLASRAARAGRRPRRQGRGRARGAPLRSADPPRTTRGDAPLATIPIASRTNGHLVLECPPDARRPTHPWTDPCL